MTFQPFFHDELGLIQSRKALMLEKLVYWFTQISMKHHLAFLVAQQM